MKLAAAVAVALLLAGAAAGSGKQTIRYVGIYCDTGVSARGTRSVVCRPHDGTGYTVLMNRDWFAIRHNQGVILWHRNR